MNSPTEKLYSLGRHQAVPKHAIIILQVQIQQEN